MKEKGKRTWYLNEQEIQCFSIENSLQQCYFS